MSLLPFVRTRKGGRNQTSRSAQPSSLVDKHQLGQQDHQDQHDHEEEEDQLPSRRNSFPEADDDFLPPMSLMTHQRSVTYGDLVEGERNEVTSGSEEGTEAEAMPVLSIL